MTEMKNSFDTFTFKAIIMALLSMKEQDFPQRLDGPSGEVFPFCPFCHESGLFARGNGGIMHTDECAIILAARLHASYLSL